MPSIPVATLMAWTLFFVSMIAGCKFVPNTRVPVEGSGVAITENRDIPETTKLRIAAGLVIDIAFGDSYELEISGDDNLVEMVTTDEQEDRLVFSIADKRRFPEDTNVRLKLTLKQLDAINVHSRAKVTVTGVENDELDLDCHNSGSLTISGRSKRLDLCVTDGARVEADELIVESAQIELRSRAGAKVHATESLEGEVRQGSRLIYAGQPQKLEVDSSGSSKIEVAESETESESETGAESEAEFEPDSDPPGRSD